MLGSLPWRKRRVIRVEWRRCVKIMTRFQRFLRRSISFVSNQGLLLTQFWCHSFALHQAVMLWCAHVWQVDERGYNRRALWRPSSGAHVSPIRKSTCLLKQGLRLRRVPKRHTIWLLNFLLRFFQRVLAFYHNHMILGGNLRESSFKRSLSWFIKRRKDFRRAHMQLLFGHQFKGSVIFVRHLVDCRDWMVNRKLYRAYVAGVVVDGLHPRKDKWTDFAMVLSLGLVRHLLISFHFRFCDCIFLRFCY